MVAAQAALKQTLRMNRLLCHPKQAETSPTCRRLNQLMPAPVKHQRSLKLNLKRED